MSLRHAVIASALGLAAPGTGHLYLGHARRFLAPFGIYVIVVAAMAGASVLASWPGYAIHVLGAVSIPAYAMVDAFLLGRRSGRALRPWYSRWFVLSAWAIAVTGLLTWGITERPTLLGYTTLRVPSRTMAPTLRPGDVVLVDTRAPRRATPPAESLVVVRHPANRELYARRVAGPASTAASDVVDLQADQSTPAEFDTAMRQVPLSAIEGTITTILWSPERRQFVLDVQPR